LTDTPSVPDRLTLAAFSAAVLIGGVNFVAVRYSNRELEPLFGAGVRFSIAALLFLGFMALRRIGIPRSRDLAVAVVYGVLSFTLTYAAIYWALQELSAGIAAVVFAATPVITLILAAVHRLERITGRGLAGALIAIGGIVVLANPGGEGLPMMRLGAVVLASIGAAEASVIVKRFPPKHQIATNGVAMAAGSALLIAVSALTGESWVVPEAAQTWTALLYLSVLGSVGLFGLILFTLGRWTASGVAYMAPLFPVVAMIAGAAIAGEEITANGVVGGMIVIVGVYVGVLRRSRRRERLESQVAEAG
jgi:drug/metabolite transporter (DMT)-like permease